MPDDITPLEPASRFWSYCSLAVGLKGLESTGQGGTPQAVQIRGMMADFEKTMSNAERCKVQLLHDRLKMIAEMP